MISRSLAVAALAAVLPLGVAACAGTNVSKGEVAAKLKSDPRFRVLNDKQRDCLADLMVKNGNKGDLKKWVDGDKKLEDVRGSSGSDVQSAAAKCATDNN